MKTVLTLLFLLGLVCSTFAANLPRLEIVLQGDYNFNQIIVEAENQLDLSIHLPSKRSDKTSRKYNQIITLQQLCDAVVAQFAQDNIPVIYTYSRDDLTFTRSDIPKKMRTSRTSSTKKTINKNIPTISEPPKPIESPTLPSWANREPTITRKTETSLPSISSKGLQNSTSRSEEPFQISLPKRVNNFEPTIPSRSQKQSMTDLDALPSIGRQPSLSTPKNLPKTTNTPKRFSITPYPENATAFINDAPSIVPGTGKENYIEWETRMLGALENQNIKVLENEKLELERRMRWLDKQLP